MPAYKVYITKWIHVLFTEHGDCLVTINKYWYSRGQQIRRTHISQTYPMYKPEKIERLIRIIGRCKDSTTYSLRPNGWSVQIDGIRSSKSLSYSPKVIRRRNSDELG